MGGGGNGVERSKGRLGGDALVELVLVRAGGFEVWALGSDRGRLAIGVPSGGLSRGGGGVGFDVVWWTIDVHAAACAAIRRDRACIVGAASVVGVRSALLGLPADLVVSLA